MIKIADIFHKQGALGAASRLLCLLVAMAFLHGQALGTYHTHDHHHDEEPEHSVCDVCILAVQDDFDFTLNQSADPDVSAVWIQPGRLVLPTPAPAPLHVESLGSIDPPPDPIRRPDTARAPPFQI